MLKINWEGGRLTFRTVCRKTKATEEGAVGIFTADFNEARSFSVGDREATVFVQKFSPQTKEPLTGADIGVIVDLHHSGQHVSKAVWIQAKRADKLPDDPFVLEDLKDQIKEMLGPHRVLADQRRLHSFDETGHRLLAPSNSPFADPGNSFVGFHDDKEKVADFADDVGADCLDLHVRYPTGCSFASQGVL